MTSGLPNIILVVFDTARWDRFGAYGYGRPTTPTFDALAAEGLQVETMIANGPWTLPSHGSLFTGLYPSQHGCEWGSGNRLRDSVTVTMAEWLRDLGYHTVCATNNGLVSNQTGLARGFDRYAFRLDLERGRRRHFRRARKVLFGGDSGGRIVNEWIRRELADAPSPLFLFVNYVECHWSYAPPLGFARRVGGTRFGFLEGLKYRATVAARTGPWEAIARAGDRELDIYSTLYDGELRNVDGHLSDLTGILDRTGHLDERSVLMVTSDHGEHLGEHGLADHHASLDDLLLRVPFVVRSPALVPAGHLAGMYEFVDVLPSLASLIGRELPSPSLEERRSDLFGERSKRGEEDYAFAEWRSWSGQELARLAKRNPSYDFSGLARDLVCVRDHRFKLTRASDGTESLHDLEADPSEEVDAAGLWPDVVRRLRSRLDAATESWTDWREDRSTITEQERLEIEAQLSQLGYI